MNPSLFRPISLRGPHPFREGLTTLVAFRQFLQECTELWSPKNKGSPNLIITPEPASSHDSNGLLFIKSALKFHFFISCFAHGFTLFCAGLPTTRRNTWFITLELGEVAEYILFGSWHHIIKLADFTIFVSHTSHLIEFLQQNLFKPNR